MIAQRNRNDVFEAPIYVGKEVPEGARKGNVGLGAPVKNYLHKRLRENAKSIREAE